MAEKETKTNTSRPTRDFMWAVGISVTAVVLGNVIIRWMEKREYDKVMSESDGSELPQNSSNENPTNPIG